MYSYFSYDATATEWGQYPKSNQLGLEAGPNGMNIVMRETAQSSYSPPKSSIPL